jgi:hypothetical protein
LEQNEAKRSDGEAMTTFGATRADHRTATSGTHPH